MRFAINFFHFLKREEKDKSFLFCLFVVFYIHISNIEVKELLASKTRLCNAGNVEFVVVHFQAHISVILLSSYSWFMQSPDHLNVKIKSVELHWSKAFKYEVSVFHA